MRGGRHRSADGINYPFPTVEEDPDEIDFDELLERNGQNIYVLAHQPGIGKTYSVMEYLVNKIEEDDDFTFFYFTDRHSAIEELLESFESLNEASAHWEGFKSFCVTERQKEIYQDYNPPIELLANVYSLSDEKTEYDKQFENSDRVFAPFNYLSHEHFTENLPSIVFLDERISQIEKYSVKPEQFANIFDTIDLPTEYSNAIKNRDYDFFRDKDERKKKINEQYFRYLAGFINGENKEGLKLLRKFHPDTFNRFLEYDEIYDFDGDMYGHPLFYKAFDVVQEGVPVVVVDATFNPRLFHYFLESYNGEMREFRDDYGGFDDLDVTIFSSQKITSDSKIYRMRPGGVWPRSSFPDLNKEWLSRDMNQFMDIFGRGNVGIITYKEYAEVCKSFGFDVEYFGALRGTNLLEDKKVLVIVGAWFPPPPSWNVDDKDKDEDKDYLDDLVRQYFLKELEKDDVADAEISLPRAIGKPYEFSLPAARHTTERQYQAGENLADKAANNPVTSINSLFWDDMYQTFHRNRPLRYPRIVIVYGWFPEPGAQYHGVEQEGRVVELINWNLREEFSGEVEKIRNRDISKFFNISLLHLQF